MSPEVFTRLVDAHYSALYRFALSLARNTTDAADLTLQTFNLWVARSPALRELDNARTWLFATLYRESVRGSKRGSRASSSERVSQGDHETPDFRLDDLARLENDVLLEALQDVDEVCRDTLSLFYLKDLTYQEIAEILGVPIGIVMSRLSRGKAQLRATLAHRIRSNHALEFALPLAQ